MSQADTLSALMGDIIEPKVDPTGKPIRERKVFAVPTNVYMDIEREKREPVCDQFTKGVCLDPRMRGKVLGVIPYRKKCLVFAGKVDSCTAEKEPAQETVGSRIFENVEQIRKEEEKLEKQASVIIRQGIIPEEE